MDINDIFFHHGENHEEWYNSIAPPIYQTSNFKLNTVEQFREKIKDEFQHYLYTRGNNPTVHILRKKIAALEGMEEALVFSSGSAAMAAAIASRVNAGDHIISVARPYTWTRKFIENWLTRFGVSHTFVDARRIKNIESAIQENTRCIIIESPNSLTFELQDLSAISLLAKKHDITTILDNSYCTPIYQKSGDFGIDIAVHSATKYLNGHGDVIAGVVCGSEAHIRSIFSNEFMMWGAIISPYEAAMILRGLRTLPLRLKRSDESAMYIASKLENHPKIRKVIHPFLPSFDQHELAKKQMKGCGGLFSIVLNTDDEAACIRFSNNLKRFAMAASWGSYESLQMPMVVFAGYSGKGPDFNLVRLYVGLEDPEYLLDDLYQALETI
jgi:cystathionine beta-lyase/cystathionine gamma-synthase